MDIDEALDDEHFISISLAGWQGIMGPGRGTRADTHHTIDNRPETCDCTSACCESVCLSLGLFFFLVVASSSTSRGRWQGWTHQYFKKYIFG